MLYQRLPKYCTGINFHIIIPTVDTLCLLLWITTAYLVMATFYLSSSYLIMHAYLI